MVESAIQQGLEDYEMHPENYNVPHLEIEVAREMNKRESSEAMVQACKRPWWICQAYVRPLPAEALASGGLTLSKREKKRVEERNEPVGEGKEQVEKGKEPIGGGGKTS